MMLTSDGVDGFQTRMSLKKWLKQILSSFLARTRAHGKGTTSAHGKAL
jgi:hypothetical protein